MLEVQDKLAVQKIKDAAERVNRFSELEAAAPITLDEFVVRYQADSKLTKETE